MRDTIIRDANIDDKYRLEELFNFFKSEEENKNRVDCYLSHNHTILAETEKDIIGVVQWHIKEDPNVGVAELEQVFVREKYRAKGIGTKLINYAIQKIDDSFKMLKIKPRRIFLFTSEDNMIARRMYEKLGFKKQCAVGDLFLNNKNELFYIFNLED